jgi:hypothetical protein
LSSEVVDQVASVEKNFSKAVNEALKLWLNEKLTMCPITKDFCINQNNPCNGCKIISEKVKKF